jgi:hypothetical protein
MAPVRQIANDAKGKVKPLFLKDLLAGKLGRKRGKKGRRSVLIFEFTPSMPPLMNTQFGNWQVSFNRAIHSTVFQVLTERFGYNNSCLCRPWTDVDWPNDHPRCGPDPALCGSESVDEDEECVELKEMEIQGALERAFEHARLPHIFAPFTDFNAIVCPIACAFVHQTKWMKMLLEFRVNYSWWLHRVTTLVPEIFSEADIYSMIYWWGDHGDDFPCEHEFWRGYSDDYQHSFGLQFILVLEYYGSKICDLILQLEETFDNSSPSTLDIFLSRRVWEALVIDWIRQDEFENLAYLYFYETPGEFFFYKDFVK